MIRKKVIKNDVADYYDNNTTRFLKSARKKDTGAIHRRLYPPIPDTDAAHYSESIILKLIQNIQAKKILDLGCGVGGSIRYLRNRYEAEYSGITLSSVQCKIAKQLNTNIELASYLDPGWFSKQEDFDLIYAIESLQHNPDHQLLARNLNKIMKPNSFFLIIDDFIIDDISLSLREEKLIKRFKKYWHAHGYSSTFDLIKIFGENGIVLSEIKELTSYMKKPVLNQHIRAAILLLLSKLPIQNSALDNIIGGGTLRLLQQLNLSGYYKLVFRNIRVYD